MQPKLKSSSEDDFIAIRTVSSRRIHRRKQCMKRSSYARDIAKTSEWNALHTPACASCKPAQASHTPAQARHHHPCRTDRVVAVCPTATQISPIKGALRPNKSHTHITYCCHSRPYTYKYPICHLLSDRVMLGDAREGSRHVASRRNEICLRKVNFTSML